MQKLSRAALAASLALACLGTEALASGGQPPFRRTPTPGVRHYHYTVTQTLNGQMQSGYRTDFDLRVDRAGVISAIVMKAEEGDGRTWKVVEPDQRCRAAMKAPRRGLATVKLWPVTTDAAKALGPAFLAECAPGGVFFPLTDILNAVVILASDNFHTGDLKAVGDRADFAPSPALSTAWARR